jgi:hypothetical protein
VKRLRSTQVLLILLTIAAVMSSQSVAASRYSVPDQGQLEQRVALWYRAMFESDGKALYDLIPHDVHRCVSLDAFTERMFGDNDAPKLQSWELKEIKGAKRKSFSELRSLCGPYTVTFTAAAIVILRVEVRYPNFHKPTALSIADIWLYIDGAWYMKGGGSKLGFGNL